MCPRTPRLDNEPHTHSETKPDSSLADLSRGTVTQPKLGRAQKNALHRGAGGEPGQVQPGRAQPITALSRSPARANLLVKSPALESAPQGPDAIAGALPNASGPSDARKS